MMMTFSAHAFERKHVECSIFNSYSFMSVSCTGPVLPFPRFDASLGDSRANGPATFAGTELIVYQFDYSTN